MLSSPASHGSYPSPSSSSSSPKSPVDFDVRFQFRNSEDIHNEILAAAQRQHQRIRNVALRTIQLDEERLAQLRISEDAVLEEERVRIKEQRASDEKRLSKAREKAKKIPAVAASRTEDSPIQPKGTPAPTQARHVVQTPPAQQISVPKAPTPPPATVQQPEPSVLVTPTPPTSFLPSQLASKPQPSASAAPKPAPFVTTTQSTIQQPTAASSPVNAVKAIPANTAEAVPSTQSHLLPHVDRYVEIHKTLKELRKFVSPEVPSNEQTKKLKKKAGEMRRTIKSSIGQLTVGKGANRLPVSCKCYICQDICQCFLIC